MDASPERRPVYARYERTLSTRTHGGADIRLYSVEEYPRPGDPEPPERYGVVVEDRDCFWGDCAAAPAIAPLARATYRSARGDCALRRHDGRECVVYLVEQYCRHGLYVPGRCGIRFVGGDGHWVVPTHGLEIVPQRWRPRD